MSNTLACPECEHEIESVDELEDGGEVSEIEEQPDGSFALFENHDIFLCKNCKTPLGISRS